MEYQASTENDDVELVNGMKRCLQQIGKKLETYYKSLYNVMTFWKEFKNVCICKYSCTEIRLDQQTIKR